MEKVGLLFPGQGSQTVGMGLSLVEHHDTAAQLFLKASSILGNDVEKLCFEGPMEKLWRVVIASPLYLCISLQRVWF